MKMQDESIDFIDQGILVGFFNEGGYVLDFSTAEFDDFTQASIGIPLYQHYGLSKGKSLAAFTRQYGRESVVKLYDDLIRFYEAHYQAELAKKPEKTRQLNRVKAILEKYRPTIPEVVVQTPGLHKVDSEYLREIANRFNTNLENGDFDTALTHARTVIEETCCYVLEKQGIDPKAKGDIVELYKKVKNSCGMLQSPCLDKRVNELLSGLEKILSAITKMRNQFGDAHGVGTKRIRIEKRHARLFVNAALTMADFILAVGDAKHYCYGHR